MVFSTSRGAWAAALLLAAGCGGAGGHSETTAAIASTSEIKSTEAARFVPSGATYAFVAPTLAIAERGARDMADGLGIPFSFGAPELSRGLLHEVGVDILSEAAVVAIGVDTQASVAVFSDGINPTLAVHLADPERFQTFLDERRTQGLKTKSVVVDGTEVFSVGDRDSTLSWAVTGEWLLVHAVLPEMKDDRKTWFAATRATATSAHDGPANWEWAKTAARAGADGLVGFADPNAMIAVLASKVADARACVAAFAPVSRIAFGIWGSGKEIRGRIAVDIGPAAAGVAAATLLTPANWNALSSKAPLAVAWNVDLDAMRSYFGPCAAALDLRLDALDEYGVRGGRAMLFDFDADDPTSSVGAVALDLSRKAYFANLLDGVPMRSSLEHRRTFGPYTGANLSVPFVGEIDYVLNDQLVMAGLGEDMLANAVGPGPAGKGSLARFDVDVEGMPAATWAAMVDKLSYAKRGLAFASALSAWRSAHGVLSLQGSEVVFEAVATRR